MRPLTALPGVEFDPELSPDGQTVAFVWGRGSQGVGNIYVQRLDEQEPRRLTEHPSLERSPTWSPDGERIAFVRVEDGEWRLYGVPAAGGPEELIAKLPGRPGRAGHADWSADGDLIAVSVEGGALGIRVADPGSPPVQYSWEDAEIFFPQFDPSGKRLAFVAHRPLGGASSS